MPDIPGVSANELAQEPGPLTAVANSIGAMLGTSERGPVGLGRVQNWEEFKLKYGLNYAGSFLAYAVKGFFDNGGSDLRIVRVMKAGVIGAIKATKNFRENDNLVDVLSVTASVAGVVGNSIFMKIEAATLAPATKYKITISNGGTPEVYDEIVDSTAAASAINGGMLCTAVALYANKTLMLIGNTYLLNGADATTGVANSIVTLVDRSAVSTMSVEALTPGVWGNRLSVSVSNNSLDAANAFDIAVTLDGITVETFTGLTMLLVEGAINGVSNYITVSNLNSVTAIPGNMPAVATSPLAGGNDGAAPADVDFENAFVALDSVDENLNIAVPGRPGANMAITIAGNAYALASGKHVFVSDFASARAEADVISDRALLGSQSYGAAYYPWILSSDIFGSGTNPVIFLPPSGHILGVMARIGSTRGVHKAPAGADCGIVGAIGVQTSIDDTIQGNLNPIGVNCIRVFNNLGVIVWGARTLSFDSKWKFLNVRLYINRVKSTFRNGFFSSVFEINDSTLWAQLLRLGTKFLSDDRKARALFGSTDAEAFFLKCDAELNTPQVIEAGQLKYRIGLNPTKPAEQIILEVTQFDGTAQIVES
jgi:phage tail sheath protein FI